MTFYVMFVMALSIFAVPLRAQAALPSQVGGVFATSDGNAGAFFGEKLSDGGLYSKTVATFAGSDSSGGRCAFFKPNCSAASSVVTGFEYVLWHSADLRYAASCDGQGGAVASGPNVGFSWGGGCHGWVRPKLAWPFFLGFSPRWTKDNVGPNTGKLAFNLDLMFAK